MSAPIWRRLLLGNTSLFEFSTIYILSRLILFYIYILIGNHNNVLQLFNRMGIKLQDIFFKFKTLFFLLLYKKIIFNIFKQVVDWIFQNLYHKNTTVFSHKHNLIKTWSNKTIFG